MRNKNVPCNPDILIVWHNVESHAIAAIDRIYLYALVPNNWEAMLEGESIVGTPSPWASVFFGANVTKVGFRTGARRNFNNIESYRRHRYIGHILVKKGLRLQISRCVHVVLHGCVHRVFADPSICVNHGPFFSGLYPLHQGVLRWIDHWSADPLIR